MAHQFTAALASNEMRKRNTAAISEFFGIQDSGDLSRAASSDWEICTFAIG
jgi:hypothetical protein